MAHAVYNLKEIEGVTYVHKEPLGLSDRLASLWVKSIRTVYDKATGYSEKGMPYSKWLLRIVFLETIAGVPGMVGGMSRHMKSLRTMERDHGWIHHLLQEAENERMHLFLFLSIYKPNKFFRTMVAAA